MALAAVPEQAEAVVAVAALPSNAPLKVVAVIAPVFAFNLTPELYFKPAVTAPVAAVKYKVS